MYSESTLLKDHQCHSLKSLFSAEIVTAAELGPASEPQPQRPKISTAEQDQDAVGESNVYLSPEQESMGDMHTEQLIHHVSRSLSSSFSEKTDTSVSPAAMFLSAFTSPATFALPDAEGEVVSGHTLGPVIGRGGFSTIRRAFSPTGGTVAVKIVRRSDLSKQGNPSLAHQRLQHEEAIWSSLRHEHILPLFSTVHTSYADFFFTLFCPSGTLFDILGSNGLPQDEAGTMFRQVVKGLRYLHEVGMLVHRDIKLENVLVDDMGVCRIGDFGMSRRIGQLDDEDEDLQELSQDAPQFGGIHRTASLNAPSSRQVKRDILTHRHRNSTPIPSSNASTHADSDHIFQPGSLPYASPELLLPQTSGPLLPDPAQDMWALGVLLYALLTGKLPFTDVFVPRLQKKILQGSYEVPSDIGRSAERILKGCLDRSVSTRWTIAMVDEVAWGVGWGEDGDVPPITDEDLDTLRKKSPTQSSASCSQSVDVIVPKTPEWQDDDTSRPSLEAARRRSSSRVERSLLRAPVLASTSKIEGRSISRLSCPPSPALNSSILRSTSSSSVSSFSSVFPDSALTTSSSSPSSLDRGRRLKSSPLQSTSRSPSPSVVPMTPVDSVDQFLRPMAVLEDQPNDKMRESSRGRKKFSRGVRTSDPELLYSRTGHTVTELDVLDETAHWVASNFETDKKSAVSAGRPSFPSLLDSGSREDREVPDAGSVESRDGRRPAVQSETAGGRAGSMPPAPTSPWSTAKGTSLSRFTDAQHSPMYAVGEFFPTSQAMPMPIPDKKSTRSRSVGDELPQSSSLVRRSLKYG